MFRSSTNKMTTEPVCDRRVYCLHCHAPLYILDIENLLLALAKNIYSITNTCSCVTWLLTALPTLRLTGKPVLCLSFFLVINSCKRRCLGASAWAIFRLRFSADWEYFFTDLKFKPERRTHWTTTSATQPRSSACYMTNGISEKWSWHKIIHC